MGMLSFAAATTAPTGEALASVAATRSAAYAAWRSYYAAHAALAAGDERLAEAAGLFSRAKQRAAEAEEAIEVSGVGAAWQQCRVCCRQTIIEHHMHTVPSLDEL